MSSDCETIKGYFYHANFICGGIKHGYETIEKETEKATSSKGKIVTKDVKREVEETLKIVDTFHHLTLIISLPSHCFCHGFTTLPLFLFYHKFSSELLFSVIYTRSQYPGHCVIDFCLLIFILSTQCVRKPELPLL